MRSHWSGADLRLAMRGGLLFDSQQAKRIASNLKARAVPQTPSTSKHPQEESN
jgi:hypothetical protein